MNSAVVGLGSNLGAREGWLRAAIDLIEARADMRVVAVSPVYCTEPVGPPQPWFLNAAVRIDTTCDPHALLEALLAIETHLGRVRAERWGPRLIDLDVLWMQDTHVAHPGLTVPHPRLAERPFALAPMLDVAPELEPDYGPELQRAGGRPSDVATLPREPALDTTRVVGDAASAGAECTHVACVGRDTADAVAAVATAVARRCGAGAARGDAWRVRRLDLDAGADGAEAVVRHAVAYAAEGWVVRRVLLQRLPLDGTPLRLLGAPADGGGQQARVRAVGVDAVAEGVRAYAELALEPAMVRQ